MSGRAMLKDMLVKLAGMMPEDKKFSATAAGIVADALADMIEKDAQEAFLASLEKVLEEESA